MRKLLFCFLFLSQISFSQDVEWLQHYGAFKKGTSAVHANDVAYDTQGNFYIVGDKGAAARFDGLLNNQIGSYDYFIAKYNSAGTLLWIKGAGVTGEATTANGIVIDANDNVYVTGSFSGTINFGGVSLTCSNNATEVFLLKYDTAGNVIWARQSVGPNGFNSDSPGGISLDNAGNIYMIGGYNDTVSFGSITLLSPGARDIFIAKYDSAGGVVWAISAVGSTGTEYSLGRSISVK